MDEMESLFICSNNLDLLNVMWTAMGLDKQYWERIDERFEGNIAMSDEWYAPLQTALRYRAFDSFRFYGEKLGEAMGERSIERLALDWTHAAINGDWWFIKEEWGDNQESCMWEWDMESQVLQRNQAVELHLLLYAASYGMEKLELLLKKVAHERWVPLGGGEDVLLVFLVAAAQNDTEKLDQYWSRFGKLLEPRQRAYLRSIVSGMGCVEAALR
jgi:hypothetical protein